MGEVVGGNVGEGRGGARDALDRRTRVGTDVCDPPGGSLRLRGTRERVLLSLGFGAEIGTRTQLTFCCVYVFFFLEVPLFIRRGLIISK